MYHRAPSPLLTNMTSLAALAATRPAARPTVLGAHDAPAASLPVEVLAAPVWRAGFGWVCRPVPVVVVELVAAA